MGPEGGSGESGPREGNSSHTSNLETDFKNRLTFSKLNSLCVLSKSCFVSFLLTPRESKAGEIQEDWESKAEAEERQEPGPQGCHPQGGRDPPTCALGPSLLSRKWQQQGPPARRGWARPPPPPGPELQSPAAPRVPTPPLRACAPTVRPAALATCPVLAQALRALAAGETH